MRNLGALVAIQALWPAFATSLTIEKRFVSPRALVLPGSWTSQGCYVDVGRTLTGGGYTDDVAMTDLSCITYCSNQGFIYAGTEYAEECYCGNTFAPGGVPAPAGDCNLACKGDATQNCGGSGRLNVYWSGTSGPQTNPGSGNWSFSGCYVEGTNGRALTNGLTTPGGSTNMTVDNCLSTCQTGGWSLAGMEYSGECYCDNSISNGAILASDGLTGCNMLCNGNHSEYCGGGGHLDLYTYNTTVALPTSTPVSLSTSSSSTKALSTSSSTKVLSTSTSSSSKTSSTSSSSTPKSSSSTLITSTSFSQSSISSTVLSSSTLPVPTLGIRSIVGAYSFLGCYTEGTGVRALSGAASYDYVGMTLEECATSCATYTYFGVEYGGECYCGNTLNIGSVAAPLTDCSFICPGSVYEYCGAGNRLEMYTLSNSVSISSISASSTKSTASSSSSISSSSKSTISSVSSRTSSSSSSVLSSTSSSTKVTSSTGTSKSSTSSSSQISSSSSSSITSSSSSSSKSTSSASSSSSAAVPTGFTYQGCFIDGPYGRILDTQIPDDEGLTNEKCIAACTAKGFKVAGMEYGIQCFCDNEIYNGGALDPVQSNCNMPCGGNSAETCGSGGHMSIWSFGTPILNPPPVVQTTGLPDNWVYKGCLQDNIASNEDPQQTLNTFPYMVWNSVDANSPAACIAQCQKYGYNAAGLEYGSECFCGDVQNIYEAAAPGTNPKMSSIQTYTRSRVPQIVADSQCNSVCSGDRIHFCGSGNLLSYYAFDGPTPLETFHFPTGNAAGSYTLLIGGVVVPLITGQAVTGKVTFIEKVGSGEPNGTGAYELDLSEIDNFNAAWRTMNGMMSDVFCSAGLTLPDKAGRQMTVGGWAGDANFGVRLYWPDGSAGVKGTNEWEEDPGVLSLQVPRWYPSAMVMANGSIMIVGGEIGQNAAQQPNLELLPATGVPDLTTVSGYSNTTVYLDFLQRTAPFNLYPFVAVVPSGGIFIAYYNEARILDEKTFQTIKTLPNMPGAVNDATGGRSYQLEGAMVLLPQHAPYTDNLGVLICGGSTSSDGQALDNCITTKPDDPSPEWTIERMPSRRVMPCMAGLPDGTYVILNGAQHGAAGFGLGADPNLNAILYDPSQPAHSRMSVMANTTVARLYHNEAITLLDGRVMISGSDPTGNSNYTEVILDDEWPEEYRVEVFTPPYLLSGLPRPTFSINDENTDWDWADVVTFTLLSGSTSNLRVSMLGSVMSTHGNAMGQRTLFPDVKCTGMTCTVTAPPSAHIAPPGWYMFFVLDGPTPSVGVFVRLGKDPANIGDWPQNMPAFQTPGV